MARDRPILLLDVMDTLVRDPFMEDVPRFFDMTLEELIRDKDPSAWIEFELDELDEQGFYRRFFRAKTRFDGPDLKRAMAAGYRWLDGVEELVAELHGSGVEMHALSNYPQWYQLIEAKLGLSRYVTWSFVSCKTRVRKPDEAAYLGAARALAVAPERCVFVDDRGINCKGAAAVGMDAIKFLDANQLRRELGERGLP